MSGDANVIHMPEARSGVSRFVDGGEVRQDVGEVGGGKITRHKHSFS